MGPTEVENMSYVTREEDLVYEKENVILDFDMCCDTPTSACGPQQGSAFSKTNMSSDEMDSDDLVCLFKLAVIFTRGNPFDSRKHWRMRCEFLETNLKIGCLEKIREVDENAAVAGAVAARFPEMKPVVRLIHVKPLEESEDYETNENVAGRRGSEDCPDEAECDIETVSEIETAVLVNSDDKRGDSMKYKGHELCSVKDDDFEDVDSSSGRKPLSGCTRNEISSIARSTCSLEALDPVALESNTRRGIFAKAFRRFLSLFRKNRVGVLPPSATTPIHEISSSAQLCMCI